MTITEVTRMAKYLTAIQQDNAQKAHLYFLSFNQKDILPEEREHFQHLCEFYRTRNAVIERLFDIIDSCAECGIVATEVLDCIHFFLYNQTIFDEINYNTYWKHSGGAMRTSQVAAAIVAGLR